MAIVLALLTAVFYGTGDFLGGLASRKARVIAVIAVGQAIGGVVLLTAALVLDADLITWGALGWGAISGVCGMTGLALLYKGFSIGVVSEVAPLSAVIGALVPLGVGFASGETPGALAWLGIVLALLACVLVSRSPDVDETPAAPNAHRTARLYGVASGIGFGLFFALIAQAGDDTGLWPAVGARGAGIPLLIGVTTIIGRDAFSGIGAARNLVVGAAICDTGANVAFLFATRRGLLGIVSVISSLYPAMTLVWARLVLHERLGRTQLGGVALAAGAITLIALG